MCGIGGVLLLHNRQGCVDDEPRAGRQPPSWTATLLQTLAHRGPDGSGVFVDDGVVLAHTRLALVDPAGGQQPITSPDARFALVVNGEVYNHRALQPRLARRGARFRSGSDAEVLLWTLILDGVAGLDDIEGEFAFCFWDARARQAVLGRDLLGVKPLVVMRDTGALWFASEVKALLAMRPRRRVVDVDAVVSAFVAPAFSGERVPFVGIENVPAGGVIVVDEHGERLLGRHRFRAASTSVHQRPEALAAALSSAVADRVVADAPVGAFFSGGVDSSAIVAAARAVDVDLPCFTIRFDHHRAGASAPVVSGSIVVDDDAQWVELLAAQWSLPLTRVHASRAVLLADINALTASQDRLVAWEQELSQRALARAAAHDVKAVLVGDAADETHFGYAFVLNDAVCASPRSLLERFGLSHRAALLQPRWRPRVDDVIDGIAKAAAQAGTPFMGAVRQRRLATTSVLLDRWLPRLLHNGDLHTMAFGLEARVPFADRRVLAIAAGVDVDEGYVDADSTPEKHFLRRAAAHWLPAGIISRRKSALPRDDGLGPLYREVLRAQLTSSATVEQLATFLEPAALHMLLDHDGDDDNADSDAIRSLLFSVLTLAGFLRHHGA